MKSLLCPSCANKMQEEKEPDIVVDVCSNCGGRFFDRNELNIIATGLSGDIEYCSVDEESHEDRYPSRKCPKCDDQTMRKINLLGHSDIIFDYCPECGGIFLDQGEIQAMNYELENLTKDKKAEEYRGSINNHLVRLDKLNAVRFFDPTGTGLFTSPVGVKYLRMSVYYNTPLDYGIRISSEKWKDKFLKAIHLFKEQDIVIGNEELDSRLIIQGEKTEKIKSLLSKQEVQDNLITFLARKPKMVYNPVTLEILDNRIVCSEGPYRKRVDYDAEEDHNGVVESMISLAEMIESETA